MTETPFQVVTRGASSTATHAVFATATPGLYEARAIAAGDLGAAAAGSDGAVQYNSGGALAGSGSWTIASGVLAGVEGAALRFDQSAEVGSGTVTVRANTLTAGSAYSIELPAAQGANLSTVQNNGSGRLSWVVPVWLTGNQTIAGTKTFSAQIVAGAGLAATGNVTATINVTSGNAFYFPASNLLWQAVAAVSSDTGNAQTAAAADGTTYRQVLCSSVAVKATAAGGVLSEMRADGDIEVYDDMRGIILTSPDATRWRITVDDTGALSTTAL